MRYAAVCAGVHRIAREVVKAVKQGINFSTMATINAHKPGSFCWIELGTSDQPAAKNFYQKLFGWTADDMPMGPNEFYTMFKLNGHTAAAGYTLRPGQQQAGVPPHWMLYIGVTNCDETANRVAALGGTVLMPPMDVFEAGRMAVLQDPGQAVFCIWQPKQNSGLQVVNEEGAFCWADLVSHNRDKAAEFYRSLFGWTIEKEDENPDHGYYHIKHGDQYIGGIPPAHYLTPEIHSHWSLYFQTTDCAGKTAQAETLGAKTIVSNLTLENVGTMSVVADPQGATFCIFQTARK
jgi:uncharacterized protein